MNSLSSVVELYRLANRPEFIDGRFSASIRYSKELKNTLESILSEGFRFGSFDDLNVDDEEFYCIQDIPASGSLLNFEFLVSQSSAESFYESEKEFIKINSLMRGEVPEQYYIVDLDYLSSEQGKPTSIKKIEAICGLITSLSKLSHFHDMKNSGHGNFYRLVFVLHSESKSSSAVIETLLSEEMLEYEEINTSLINSLASIKPASDFHYDEKVNTFRNTLIEYINSSEITFKEIIKNWGLITTLYSNNLAVYMSAFSFQKARKEVAETEIEYADKISKITTEIANKALAIPISLVASIAIFQLTGKIEISITFSGLVIASIIISLIIISQQKQLNRISHAKDIVFSSIEKKIQDDNSDLKIRLIEAKEELKSNAEFCNMVLKSLMTIAWVPVGIGTLGLLYRLIS
ncbi:hypothetical protein [Ewingella americana]|uniref:Phage protein n=2 Tax=Ewingella americana TaxID=41202 RepID=A0A085G121_EWIA3|nr:hypothetical protein [Ewingella americana]KAA8726728.1 hypothetical protein F4W05_17845 [Ewingella americana]KFC77416.1 hypothetical protein GEAM_4267 [Ewingella americana ATCC 33852]STS10364.1 Uncharacterised protein [Ewingella americana]